MFIRDATLGRGPRLVHDALLPHLHIGAEGERIFDFAAIVARVHESRLVGEAFAGQGRRR